MLQKKSSFGFHRTTSINSEADSLLEEDVCKSASTVTSGSAQSLRKQLKILKERNIEKQKTIDAVLVSLDSVRENNVKFIREGLKVIKATVEPTTEQYVHAKFLMDEHQAPIYLKQLMSTFVNINAEATCVQAALNAAQKQIDYYTKTNDETDSFKTAEKQRSISQVSRLSEELKSATNLTEQKLYENLRLQQTIKEKRLLALKLASQTDELNRNIENLRKRKEEVENELVQTKTHRSRLDGHCRIIQQTLSKHALIEKEDELRKTQIRVMGLQQANSTVAMGLSKASYKNSA